MTKKQERKHKTEIHRQMKHTGTVATSDTTTIRKTKLEIKGTVSTEKLEKGKLTGGGFDKPRARRVDNY